MKKDSRQIRKYAAAHRRQKRRRTLVTSMAAVVVFCTVYALILPAITLEAETYCGLEEHVHSAKCYTSRLVCTLEEGPAHVHDDSCYENKQTLICGKEESDGHTHDETCTQRQLTCTEDHEHTDACFETAYICGLEQSEPHHHTDACYQTERVVTCTASTGSHTHTDSCYENALTCPLEAHTHTLACYSDPQADVETEATWGKAASKVDRTGNWSADLVSVAESQRAYEESTKNYHVETDEVTGEEIKKGYTRYGAWYNAKYNGDTYGDWSAMYLSFCLEYAGIPEEDFPREAATETWRRKLSGDWEGYQDCHFYIKAEDHTPAPGQIVFLDENNNQKSDRVVLITELTFDETEETPILIGFKTIGGDVSLPEYPDAADAVDVEEFDLADSRILGYAALPENPDKLEDPELVPEQPTLTEEEAAQVNDIIARIDALPSLEELREALAASTQPETADTQSEPTSKTDEEGENIPSSASAMPEAEGEPSVSQKVAQLYSEYCSMTAEQQEAVTNSDKLLSLAEELGLTEERIYCGKETHTHGETCYDEAGALTCASEAHTHTLACYSDPAADVESEEEWASSVSGAEITGFFRDDLLAVANTQLGYTESAKNYRVLEDGETIKGYTRYGHWYGGESVDYAYNDWSAMFVSFCLNFAQISEDTFPRSESPAQWMEQLQIKEGLYAQAGTESPEEGELVFFDRDSDSLADQVGIVSALVRGNVAQEGSEAAAETAAENTASEETVSEEAPAASPQLIGFTCIQGDIDGAVAIQDYTLDDAAILGYGKLPKGETVLTAEGADYTITVRYSALAELPEGTRLVVSEIQPGTDEYLTYAARAAQAMNEEEGQVTRRFFDLTLMSGDQAWEPKARVKVDVSFPDRPVTVEEETVLHFPEDSVEPEVLTATVDEEGLHYEQETFSVVGFTANSIDTSKTYALVANGYALTVQNGALTAVATSDPPAAQYVQWQFTYSNQSGRYSVKTTVGSTDYYLVINGNNNNNRTLGLQANSGTTFSAAVTTNNGNPSTVVLSRSYSNSGGGPGGGGSTTFYVTMSGTNVSLDRTASNATEFSLYYDPDAGKVATISPSSTTIDLFDYRTHMDDTNNNYKNWKEDGYSSGGINVNHALQFGNTGNNTGTNANTWTGDGGGVFQGIVESTLGSDGYPKLSTSVTFQNNQGTSLNNLAASDPSLSYLFNANDLKATNGQTIKKAYTDVKGLLQLGSDGYYYYDCTRNYAEFPVNTTATDGSDDFRESTNNNRFNVYDTDNDQFFPFDAYTGTANHFFGMHIKTYFVQNYNGFADDQHTTHTTFEFSGDDDVWIFIDGVLVADLGGIHGAATVKIDFAAGTVYIDNVYQEGKKAQTKTFSQIFKGTGVETTVYDETTTLVNNSSHTLDFFYLERGGNASNMKVKYNLLEIPATSIYKIDQYGDPLAGAEFAVYGATKQADDTYRYNTNQTNDDGTWVTVSLNNYAYWDGEGTAPTTSYWQYRGADESGGDKWDILVTTITANEDSTTTETQTTIPCKYHGVTDGNGEMIFQSENGSILSLEDMAERFGSHFFILREVDVPDGYRTVSDESWFHIDEDAGVMLCDSTYTSGVWASNNAWITAENTLDVATEYNSVAAKLNLTTTDNGATYTIPYVTTSDGTTTSSGTLFAVVLKRNGRNFAQGLGYNYWFPVYGSDEKGYKVVENGVPDEDLTKDFTNCPTNVTAAIEAAKQQVKISGGDDAVVFTPVTSGTKTSYKLLMENLPGKIDRYFTYMLNTALAENGNDYNAAVAAVKDADTASKGADPQYTIAYYWTSGTLEGADATNTVRVYSHDGLTTGNFSVEWGTTIEVPNMQNTLYFQKRDEAKSTSRTNGLLNGAVFAMYPAHDAEMKNEDGTGTGTYLVYYEGTTSRDANETGEDVWIIPYQDGSGNAAVFGTVNGAVKHLGDGPYEFYTEDLQFSESGGTVYSNTGVAGLMTVTLTKDAEGNEVTNGASYYVHPAKNADGTPLVGVTHSTCSYVDDPGTGHFNKLLSDEYYLREIYAPSGYELNTTDIPVVVNDIGVFAYAGDETTGSTNGVSVGNGVGYLSKTLDVFANLNEIDESLAWVYGALLRSDATGFTAFEQVAHDVIHVADTDWKFVKQVDGDPTGYGSGAVEKADLSGDGDNLRSHAMVTYYEYAGDLTPGKETIFDYAVNDDQTGQDARAAAGENGVATQAGQGTLRLYSRTGWTDLAIYQDYAYGNTQNPGVTYYEDLTAKGNLSNLFSSSTFVQVVDKSSSVDLKVVKTDEKTPATALQAAVFRLKMVEYAADGTTVTDTSYYHYDEDTESVMWVTGENPLEVIEYTTNKAGEIIFHDLAPRDNAKYFLEELSAPAGYVKRETEIQFTVTQTVEATGETTVPTLTLAEGQNDVTLTDPETDASGTPVYTLTVPNSPDPNIYYAQVNLDLTKIIQGTTTPLSGAEFQLYREENGEKLYYKRTAEQTSEDGTVTPASTSWVALTDTEKGTTLTSGTDGKVQTFFDLQDVNTTDGENRFTTYYLVETKAPDGYNLLTEPITIDVDITDGTNATPTVTLKVSVNGTNIYSSDGTNNPGSGGYSVTPAEPTTGEPVNNVVTVTYGYALTVPNSMGYRLPDSGGEGTVTMTLLGLMLAAIGGFGLVWRRKRGDVM